MSKHFTHENDDDDDDDDGDEEEEEEEEDRRRRRRRHIIIIIISKTACITFPLADRYGPAADQAARQPVPVSGSDGRLLPPLGGRRQPRPAGCSALRTLHHKSPGR